jgi:DNA-binding PadR family transcriptional regulator
MTVAKVTMSLPHALLTALIERPCSGSELAGRFDRSIGYFWQATHQQIYRELARLEAAGSIESLPHESGRGRKRKYRVLRTGRDELKRWVGEALSPLPIREEILVRLRAEAVIGPTRLAEELERLAAHHREKLAIYRKIEARDFPPGRLSREQRLRHLVLKAGIEFESQRIAFCEEAIAILRMP